MLFVRNILNYPSTYITLLSMEIIHKFLSSNELILGILGMKEMKIVQFALIYFNFIKKLNNEFLTCWISFIISAKK